MISKTKQGSLLLGLSVITVTTVYGDIRPEQYGRHYLGHDHQHHNPLQSNRAPGGASGWDLTAGVSKVLGQLRLSCTQEKQFRALNLDISCPAHLPLPTSCRCVTRSKTGGVVTKVNGTISTYDSKCECGAARALASSSQHVITRSSCCTTDSDRTDEIADTIAAVVAEPNTELVLCPAEAPYKAKYRSEAGLVSCGEARLVGRCLCLDTSPGAKVKRQVGTVVGTQCRCKQNYGYYNSEDNSPQVVVRAVCCSDNPSQDHGEVVITQN